MIIIITLIVVVISKLIQVTIVLIITTFLMLKYQISINVGVTNRLLGNNIKVSLNEIINGGLYWNEEG